MIEGKSVVRLFEIDRLTDNGPNSQLDFRPDFAVVKGVANGGRCRGFAVRNLHQNRPDVRYVSSGLGRPFLFLENPRGPSIEVGDCGQCLG